MSESSHASFLSTSVSFTESSAPTPSTVKEEEKLVFKPSNLAFNNDEEKGEGEGIKVAAEINIIEENQKSPSGGEEEEPSETQVVEEVNDQEKLKCAYKKCNN